MVSAMLGTPTPSRSITMWSADQKFAIILTMTSTNGFVSALQ